MTMIPCRARTRESVDELPPFELTATSEMVPEIERHASSMQTEVAEALSTELKQVEPEEKDHPPARRSRTRLWTSLGTLALLGLMVYTLRDKFPSLHSVSIALTSAQPRWVLIAAVLETASLGMFARQQRALLRAMSVQMSMSRALAITYARSAISITMPAGSAVSAAFAYQQYRRGGGSRDHAAAVMVLSGIISFAGLGVLYVTGIAGVVVVSPQQAWHTHSGLIIVVAVATAASLAAWIIAKRLPSRPSIAAYGEIVSASDEISRVRRWTSTAVISVRQNVAVWRTVRPRHWIFALAYAMLNWLFDLLCLAAAAEAFGLQVGILTLASIYLGVQLVRQVPVTPGGIGLIETGLLAGFAALGAPAATAAAVVLTYRILSCWLLIPIGGLAWLGLRGRPIVADVTNVTHQELAPATAEITAG